MRAVICCLVTVGFVGALLTGPTRPIPSATQTAVNFFLATCQDSANNLAAVAELATQQSWTSMLNPATPENDPVKVHGMWQVSQNGQSYSVVTGTGPQGPTICQVLFDDPRPRRRDFMAAVSKRLMLKTVIDQVTHRYQTFQIENLATKNVTLEFSAIDGTVFRAAVIGP